MGRAVALLGLTGFLASCTALVPLNRPAMAGTIGDADGHGPSAPQVSDNFDIADLEKQFAALSRRVAPAVVSITATEVAVETDRESRTDEINPDRLARVLDPLDRTVGTGFVVDADGYIVTNEHVVGHAEQIWITTDDKKVYPAMVVGTDPRSDLAVLKIPASRLPVVTFAPEGEIRRGQWSVAVGNPYGYASGGEMCVSVGIVGALGRSLPKLSGKEDRLYSDMIQTTAQINPGNSGGPLFDIQGRVIGINTAVILPQKQTNGIGFALPTGARFKEIVRTLKDGREVTYAYAGVHVETLTSRECKEAGAPSDTGVRIDLVEPNSPAAAAQLRIGDVLTRIDGQAIHDAEQFVRVAGAAPIGVQVKAEFLRSGKPSDVTLTLKRRELSAVAVTRETQRLRWRGLVLGPIPATWRPADPAAKKPEAGVVVIAVDPKSPLARQVTAGVVLTTVAGKTVADIQALQQIVNDLPPEQCALGICEPVRAVVATSVQERE